jgi:betaine reductase
VERAGIPTVVITNLVTIAKQVGAPRIVQGRGIPYPAGDPDLPPEAERAWRRRLVARCLEALATPVEHPTVFQVDTAPTAKEAAGA